MVDWNDVDAKLTDPAYFAGPHFHELFTLLRREDPVHWTTGSYSRGYWSVTRYEDCLRLLDEPELFSSAAGTHLPPDGRDLTEEERYKLGYDVQLVVADPPGHAGLRRPFNKHFSVPAVAKMHESCESIVDDIIAKIAPNGEAELVEDIAAQLPVNLFLSIMGVPKEDWADLRKITLTMLHPQDPEFLAEGMDPTQAVVEASAALYDYVYKHTMARRGNPADDFASLIANIKVGDELLDERQAGWMSFSVVAGGLETTRNAAAIGIMELMARPEQARLIRDNPAVAKSAVEEIIRWVTPSKNRLRVATADTVLGGKKIKKGDWIVGWIVSANRDETVFDNPQEFDILRTPNKHLGFGDGEHICLGRNVARLELQVLLQKVFAAFPDLSPNGEAEWVASDNTTGLKRLPVKFTPRAAVSA
ncbi:cytochrome P450 [Streptosporangium sp. NPDC087985]|uniref:cytochrome P450 n=1 Tax=Streptosporangium sp. NPDC087985 TaxID=3366196 RepID=UPI00382D1D4B